MLTGEQLENNKIGKQTETLVIVVHYCVHTVCGSERATIYALLYSFELPLCYSLHS